jgi:hypothetical protein
LAAPIGDEGSVSARWVLPTASSPVGARVGAAVEVAAAEPLRDVVLRLTATGPVAVAVPGRQALGTVVPGAPAHAGAPFTVAAGGTGTVHATLTARTADGRRVATRVDVDFAAGAGRAALSRAGLLHAQVRALGFERDALGTTRYERRLHALLGGGASERAATVPPRLGPSAPPPATTPVGGTIRWTAIDGSTHPARSILIEVIDADGSPDGAEVGATMTDATGGYSVTVSTLRGDGTARHLFVRALARGPGFRVMGPGASSPQHIDGSEFIANGAPWTIDLTANNSADNNTAFAVADAMTTGMEYTRRINGGVLFDTVNVSFPRAATDYTKGMKRIRVQKTYRFSWDVILHEYGHFVADRLGIDASPGGRHTWTQNMGETLGKDAGTRDAWSEGFASWFGLTAEDELGTSALHIPYAGDGNFDYTEPHTVVPIANDSLMAGQGEDNELSVARTLWHIHEDPKIALGDVTMIAALKATAATTLSAAIPVLMYPAHAAYFDDNVNPFPPDPTAMKRSNDFGCLLTDEAVAPSLNAPASGSHINAAAAPFTYSWDPAGGGRSHRLNQFIVQFWSRGWDTLIYQSAPQTTTSFTPNAVQWDQIINQPDRNGKLPRSLRVVVRGYNTDAPVSGPYKSCAITQPVDPNLKAWPLDAPLTPYPAACEGIASPETNQFLLDGHRLKPNTTYTVKLSDPATGYPAQTLGTATSDADGNFARPTLSIPLMPAHVGWKLTAKPSTGATAAGKTDVGAINCFYYFEGGGYFVTVNWGGGGYKPGSTVTETWNGSQSFNAVADATGTVAPMRYGFTCPQSVNTVTVDFTTVDGPGQSIFHNIGCTPPPPRPADSPAKVAVRRSAWAKPAPGRPPDR